MPYQFERGRIYRMPTHFGPAPGPRQIPAEANADPTRSPRKKVISTSFLTDGSALERHIPERFALAGEPVITVEFHYMTANNCLIGPNAHGCTLEDEVFIATGAAVFHAARLG